jgi:FAD/FMN-containing dehydrogenase
VSKIAHYLQEHLLGEVTASLEVRKHFAYDASILGLAPQIVAYPRNENDVRKTARFAWQLAERGRPIPITARGGGSNTSGSAIGSGIVLAFTAHMNRILAMDPGKESITVEPGVIYDKLEQALYTHGLFLPPYPGLLSYATVGGGLSTNVVGEKSIKYGATINYVQQLRVVLANGEIIETGNLSKRELNHKLGLTTFEGEIYRALDTLLEENAALIAEGKKHLRVLHNATGYNIFDIKKGHSFDLTPLIVGSLGTLGIITEATLKVVPNNPITSLVMISLENLNDLHEILPKIMALKPSICDMLNQAAVKQVLSINPNQLVNVLSDTNAAIHLFVEFDDPKPAVQKKSVKQLQKIIERIDGICQVATTLEEQERIWKIRHSVATILTQPQGQSMSVPVAEDVCVPINRLVGFLDQAARIYGSCELSAVAWGHAGEGIVRMQPVLDLSKLGDRQKLFKLSNEIYAAVIQLGGSITASAGDGRIRAPYLRNVYGDELYNLMMQVKRIFDPHNILNPGVKTTNLEDVKSLMRSNYSPGHRYEHLPRS